MTHLHDFIYNFISHSIPFHPSFILSILHSIHPSSYPSIRYDAGFVWLVFTLDKGYQTMEMGNGRRRWEMETENMLELGDFYGGGGALGF